jgi:hypothetical protein
MSPRVLCLALVAAVASSADAAWGQGKLDTTSVGTAKLLQADYAVPDAPALKIIDADESKLLRPVSVRSLITTLSSATGDFSFIPRALAVEFSPLMLVNGEHLTLHDYKKKPWAYRLRVSLAAKRDTGSSARNQLALGLRMGFQDNSDLRTNEDVIRTILALTSFEVDSGLMIGSRYVAAGLPRTGPKTPGDSAAAKPIEKQLGTELHARSARLVDSAKTAQENAKWNADVFDMAVAARSSSSDSTAKNTRFDGVSVWLTKGWGFAPGWQLLFGGRYAYERNLADTTSDDLENTFDAVTRMYVGSNKYKVLVELQGTGRTSSAPKWVGNGGGELQLGPTLWVNASAGYEATGDIGSGHFISSFKIKFIPPKM